MEQTFESYYGDMFEKDKLLPQKKKRKKDDFDRWLDQQLQDPEFRTLYEKQQPERELILQLVKARAELNLSQKELAEKLGIKQSHISRLENGNHNPSLAFMQRLAEGLGRTLYIEFREK